MAARADPAFLKGRKATVRFVRISVATLPCGLEEFHEIAVGVLEQDLQSAGTFVMVKAAVWNYHAAASLLAAGERARSVFVELEHDMLLLGFPFFAFFTLEFAFVSDRLGVRLQFHLDRAVQAMFFVGDVELH